MWHSPELSILALRHQLAIANRSRRPRLRFTTVDRLLWAWLSKRWAGWRAALHVVQPATVLVWHRRAFRLFWTSKSRHRTGRPGVPADVRALIREMSAPWQNAYVERVIGSIRRDGRVHYPSLSHLCRSKFVDALGFQSMVTRMARTDTLMTDFEMGCLILKRSFR